VQLYSPQQKKPFDALAEGLFFVQQSRGDRTAIELFVTGVGVYEVLLALQISEFVIGRRAVETLLGTRHCSNRCTGHPS
jgi:hypothetical protein